MVTERDIKALCKDYKGMDVSALSAVEEYLHSYLDGYVSRIAIAESKIQELRSKIKEYESTIADCNQLIGIAEGELKKDKWGKTECGTYRL